MRSIYAVKPQPRDSHFKWFSNYSSDIKVGALGASTQLFLQQVYSEGSKYCSKWRQFGEVLLGTRKVTVSHSSYQDLQFESVKREKMWKYFSVTCCAMSEKYCFVPPSPAAPHAPKIPRLRLPVVLIGMVLTFRRRIKSRLPFAGIIRMLPYSTGFQDKG